MKATTNNTNNKELTAKELSALKRKITEEAKGFNAACRNLAALAESDATARKVCAYLGLSKTALSAKNLASKKIDILAKIPFFYVEKEGGIHKPARLKKVSKELEMVGLPKGKYIAVEDTYVNALLTLAKVLSKSTTYTTEQLTPTKVFVDEDGKLNEEFSICEVYDIDKKSNEVMKVGTFTESYAKYMTARRIANEVAKIHKVETYRKEVTE